MTPPSGHAPGPPPDGPDPRALEQLRRELRALSAAASKPKKGGGRTRPADFLDPDPDDGDPDRAEEGPWWAEEPPAKPIKVRGGIAARTRRGSIGSSWWSRRFLESLEAVVAGGRVDRGRSYARRGQVRSLSITPGVVEASVQGSRRTPYRVRLTMPVVPDDDRQAIVAALGARAGYAARMLAGELPPEVEEVFATQAASLLPGPHARLTTACTCPDWENPCKHVAAVCYLLAEEFDREPFSLLRWRGLEREPLLESLRSLRAHGEDVRGTAARSTRPKRHRTARSEVPAAPPTPGPDAGPDRFWLAGPELAAVHVRPEASPWPGAVLRQLKRGVLLVGDTDLADELAPVYRRIVESAARRAVTAPGR